MYFSRELKNQFLAAIPVIFTEFIQGLGYGWIAPTLRQIMDNPTSELTLTTEQASWIGSLHEAGRTFGPLLTISLLGRIGRKGVFTATSVAFFVAFTLVAFSKSVPIIYASRLAFGVAVGMNDVTASIYISENFKSTLRGLLGSIAVACSYGGVLLDLCLVNYFDYETVAYTNAVLAFLTLSNIVVSTETVPFLIAKGRHDQAWKNFLWLRGKDVGTTSAEEVGHFEQLKRHISEQRNEKRSITAYLSNPFYRKTITLVLLFSMLLIATGYSSVNSFASITFTKGVFTPNEFTMVFGALQFASAVLTPTFIEKANRRTILIISLIVAMVVHAVTALLFFLQKDDIYVSGFSWWVFAMVTVYALVYSSGITTVFYTTRGELMPQNVSALGGSIVIMSHGLISFLTAKVFLIVDEMFGMYWNFIFYSVMSLVGVLFVYFVLPETRGKSLMQIQIELRAKNSTGEA